MFQSCSTNKIVCAESTWDIPSAKEKWGGDLQLEFLLNTVLEAFCISPPFSFLLSPSLSCSQCSGTHTALVSVGLSWTRVSLLCWGTGIAASPVAWPECRGVSYHWYSAIRTTLRMLLDNNNLPNKSILPDKSFPTCSLLTRATSSWQHTGSPCIVPFLLLSLQEFLCEAELGYRQVSTANPPPHTLRYCPPTIVSLIPMSWDRSPGESIIDSWVVVVSWRTAKWRAILVQTREGASGEQSQQFSMIIV